MTVLVDTRTVLPHERFEFWADASCQLFHPLELRQSLDRPFWGTLSGCALGHLQVFRLAADTCRAARTLHGISTSDPECLLVAVQASGCCVVTQEGRTATLAAGDVASYESSHPYTVHATTPFELVVFTIPRSILGSNGDQLCRRTAHRIPGADTLGQIAIPFLLQIADRLDDAGCPRDSDFDLGESVLDLIRGLYAGRPHGLAGRRTATTSQIALRVKSFIEENLGDPRLSPATIAHANSISVRYLYKVFEPDEISIRAWIQNRRLEHCRRDLADPSSQHDTILRIASRWGWTSAAHFSRRFHDAYGCSPTTYRTQARRITAWKE